MNKCLKLGIAKGPFDVAFWVLAAGSWRTVTDGHTPFQCDGENWLTQVPATGDRNMEATRNELNQRRSWQRCGRRRRPALVVDGDSGPVHSARPVTDVFAGELEAKSSLRRPVAAWTFVFRFHQSDGIVLWS